MGTTQMSLGTENTVRYTFLRGFYHCDDKALENCAGVLQRFDGSIHGILSDYKKKRTRIGLLNSELAAAERCIAYMPVCVQRQKIEELQGLKVACDGLRARLIDVMVATMEEKKLMREPVTLLTLKKMPLTLRGAVSDIGDDELDEENPEQI